MATILNYKGNDVLETNHFYNLKYWSKNTALLLWSLFITGYVFIISHAEPVSVYSKFLYTFVSVVFIGGFWNYITDIYKTPLDQYHHKHCWAACSVLVTLIVIVVIGALAIKFYNVANDRVVVTLMVFYVCVLFSLPIYIIKRGDCKA